MTFFLIVSYEQKVVVIEIYMI